MEDTRNGPFSCSPAVGAFIALGLCWAPRRLNNLGPTQKPLSPLDSGFSWGAPSQGSSGIWGILGNPFAGMPQALEHAGELLPRGELGDKVRVSLSFPPQIRPVSATHLGLVTGSVPRDLLGDSTFPFPLPPSTEPSEEVANEAGFGFPCKPTVKYLRSMSRIIDSFSQF